jgi:cytochrome bd-type quinol oxidase subunit 1
VAIPSIAFLPPMNLWTPPPCHWHPLVGDGQTRHQQGASKFAGMRHRQGGGGQYAFGITSVSGHLGRSDPNALFENYSAGRPAEMTPNAIMMVMMMMTMIMMMMMIMLMIMMMMMMMTKYNDEMKRMRMRMILMMKMMIMNMMDMMKEEGH